MLDVYKRQGLDIGTAKVTPEETCGIPHHGVDILTPDKAFSVEMCIRDSHRTGERVNHGRAVAHDAAIS